MQKNCYKHKIILSDGKCSACAQELREFILKNRPKNYQPANYDERMRHNGYEKDASGFWVKVIR